MSGTTGNGPSCPVDPTHGKTYYWADKTSVKGRDFWCGHQAHGGNGRFFTDKEAHGEYELTETDVSRMIESYARDVIAGKVSLDLAVTNVAKHTKMATSQVREALSIMIGTIKEKDEDMADKKAAAKTAKAKAAAPKATGERHRLEKIEASEFVRVRDEAGLTQKQAQEACKEAGMGASSTYVYILTHEGASVKLFDRFKDAVGSYAKKHKAEIAAARKEASKAVAAKTEPKAPKAAAKAPAPAKATVAKAKVSKAPAAKAAAKTASKAPAAVPA